MAALKAQLSTLLAEKEQEQVAGEGNLHELQVQLQALESYKYEQAFMKAEITGDKRHLRHGTSPTDPREELGFEIVSIRKQKAGVQQLRAQAKRERAVLKAENKVVREMLVEVIMSQRHSQSNMPNKQVPPKLQAQALAGTKVSATPPKQRPHTRTIKEERVLEDIVEAISGSRKAVFVRCCMHMLVVCG